MKKILAFLLFLCLFGTLYAQGDAALPVLRLDAALLDYVVARPGILSMEGFSTPVTVKYRGSYSVTFAGKRNYTLHLKTEAGAQRKHALLGLREDDDYALLGGLSDMSRLRGPVGLSLWRDLGHPAPRTAACELYFCEYYKGIYFLVERPDRKSADLPKGGALYRVVAPSVDGVDVLSAPPAGAPEGETWYNIRKVYPEEEAGWQPLLSLLRGDDPAQWLNLSAFADYYLFVNLTGAADNMKKNLYLCWDGTAFYPMPWDLDASFGRLYNAAPSDPEAWHTSRFFSMLLTLPGFETLLRERWAALRPLLSPDSVMARFQALYDLLDESGAWARELQRFPTYTDSATSLEYTLDPEAELAFIRSYLTDRFALLDSAYSPQKEQ